MINHDQSPLQTKIDEIRRSSAQLLRVLSSHKRALKAYADLISHDLSTINVLSFHVADIVNVVPKQLPSNIK